MFNGGGGCGRNRGTAVEIVVAVIGVVRAVATSPGPLYKRY